MKTVSLLKAAFLFVRKRGGKWEEKSPPLRSDTLRHATFHRFSQKGRGGRVKQVTHRWPRACFMSLPCLVPRPPGRYLKQKHLRASMLLCGAIPDPTINL